MAFDSSIPSAALVADPLAFHTTQGALDAYRLACLSLTPGSFRDAAHRLASALEAERRKPHGAGLGIWAARNGDAFAWGYRGGEFQFGGFATLEAARESAAEMHPGQPLSWVEPPAVVEPGRPTALRKPRSTPAVVDPMTQPLGSIPKAKRVVGAFLCAWDDGTETRQHVAYNGGRPELRWAAAFQACERLRRLRLRPRNEYDPSGPAIDWFSRMRDVPLPYLVAIQDETTGDVYTPPEGALYGVTGLVSAKPVYVGKASVPSDLPAPQHWRAGPECPADDLASLHGSMVVFDAAEHAARVEEAQSIVEARAADLDIAKGLVTSALEAVVAALKDISDDGGPSLGLQCGEEWTPEQWAVYEDATDLTRLARADLESAIAQASDLRDVGRLLTQEWRNTPLQVRRDVGGQSATLLNGLRALRLVPARLGLFRLVVALQAAA